MRIGLGRLSLAVSFTAAASSVAYLLLSQHPRTVPMPRTAPTPVSRSPDTPAQSPAVKPEVTRPIQARLPTPQSPGQLRSDFLKSQRCYQLSHEAARTRRLADCKAYEEKPEFERVYAWCLRYWVEAQDHLTALETQLASCGSESDIVNNYFRATKDAAKSGDVDAQLCYVAAGFDYMESQFQYSAEDVEAYMTAAPHYIADAFGRGDWRIVSLLSNRHVDPSGALLRLVYDGGDTQNVYKMSRLLRLGATGEYAAMLDALMNEMVHPYAKADAALSESQVADADAWAQEEFTQHFSSSTTGVTHPPIVCGDEDYPFWLPPGLPATR